MAGFDQLEHRLLRCLRALPSVRRVGLAVSGGADSMALLELMYRLRKIMGVELIVFHIHHGLAQTTEQFEFRDQASAFVENEARLRGLTYRCEKWTGGPLKGEAELRRFRLKGLEQLRQETASDAVFIGHHLEDLLETRMIRLVRGLGPKGLKAMAVVRGFFWRPLLEVHREELKAYLKRRDVTWREDPSNAGPQTLRGFVRHSLLPSLERVRPGATTALARSLDHLATEIPDQRQAVPIALVRGTDSAEFSRSAFSRLREREKQSLVAQLLFGHSAESFTLGQIKEVCRRLDTDRKRLKFHLRDCVFTLNAQHVIFQIIKNSAESIEESSSRD